MKRLQAERPSPAPGNMDAPSPVQRALTCFRQPAFWLALGLLLLNDRVLKQVVPSWFTGKLSDFAGLLVFPILMATLLLPIATRLRLTYRAVGAAAFLVTAVWFALLKTAAPVNLATIQLWEVLSGQPVQIVRDPTDLIALPILWAGWRSWTWAPQRTRPSNRPVRSRLFALGAVGLTLLATLGSSYEQSVYAFRLALVDGQLYVGTASPPDWTIRTGEDPGIFSCDAALKCEDVPVPVSSAVFEALIQPRASAAPICAPTDQTLCFRAGVETIEESSDGGQTWQVAWQVPSGRRDYILRAGRRTGDQSILLGPYDLIFLPSDMGGSILVVALGNEGLLLRDETGAWKRRMLAGDARPTPFKAKGFLAAHLIFTEMEFALWTSLLLAILAFGVIVNLPRRRLTAAAAAAVAIWIPIRWSLYLELAIFRTLFVVAWYLVVFALALAVAGFWRRRDPEGRETGAIKFWLASLTLGVSAAMPMILWSLGHISYYAPAANTSLTLVALAVMLALASLIGVRRARQPGKTAVSS